MSRSSWVQLMTFLSWRTKKYLRIVPRITWKTDKNNFPIVGLIKSIYLSMQVATFHWKSKWRIHLLLAMESDTAWVLSLSGLGLVLTWNNSHSFEIISKARHRQRENIRFLIVNKTRAFPHWIESHFIFLTNSPVIAAQEENN